MLKLGAYNTLNLKADLSSSKVKVEGAANIVAFDTDVKRIRGLIELARTQCLGATSVDLSIASGVRYEDAGSTNIAGEISAAAKATIKTNNPQQPVLSLQLNGYFLKGQDKYEEWGLQGLIQLGIRKNTGLSFSLTPGYGTTQTALDNIWTEVGHSQSTYRQQPRMQLKTRLDYRLKFNGFLTPYTEMDFGDTTSTYTIGMRWQPSARIDFDLSVRQFTWANASADQAVLLETRASF